MEVDFKCTMVSQFSDWLLNCLHVPIKGKRRPQGRRRGKELQNYQNELFDFLMKQG